MVKPPGRFLPTVCKSCGYHNGGKFWKCPLCKREV
jgi:predicted Zn-ribbon and HTH transcriptional regulator